MIGTPFIYLLTDESRVMRVTKILIWISIGLAIQLCFPLLRTLLYLSLVLAATTVIMYWYTNKLLNSVLDEVMFDYAIKDPVDLFTLLEYTREHSLVEDLINHIKALKLQKIIPLIPVVFLPSAFSLFIAFITAFTVQALKQSSIDSYGLAMLGLATMIISLVALILMLMRGEYNESDNGQVSQGPSSSSVINDIQGFVNDYVKPKRTGAVLGHVYLIGYYLMSCFPKPKVHLNIPKVFGDIYVCNNDLKNKLMEFLGNENKNKVNEVLTCNKILNLSSILGIESPYRFLIPNDPRDGNDKGGSNSFVTIKLNKNNARIVIAFKAWKGSIIEHNNKKMKCKDLRLISVLAVGHEKLLRELELILRLYSRVPNEHELIECAKNKK